MKVMLALVLSAMCGGIFWAVLSHDKRTPEDLGALIVFGLIWIFGSAVILVGAPEQKAGDVNEVAHTPTIDPAELIKIMRRDKPPRSKP